MTSNQLLQQIRDNIPEQDLWDRYGLTRAVVVCDSSGFTRQTEQYGIYHFLGLIAELRDLVIPVFELHGGTGFRTEADNIYALFETVDQAIDASVKVHNLLSERNSQKDKKYHCKLCIGIGYGRLLDAGHEGVYGQEMNLASKLGEDIADPYEILLTQNAFEQSKHKIDGQTEQNMVELSGLVLDYHRLNNQIKN